MEDLLALGTAEQRQLSHRSVRIRNERLQQVVQVIGHPLNTGFAPARTVIAVLDGQCFPEHGSQGQGVIGLLTVRNHAETQPLRRPFLKCLGNRIVLEHHQGIEQRLAPKACPALNLIERRVFELAQGQVARLHLFDPFGHALLRAGCTNDRQCIDEQADLFLHPRQLCRTPGYGGTETHSGLPGVALQQKQPRRLEQRIDGHPIGSGKPFDALGECLIEHLMKFTLARQFLLRRVTQHLSQPRRLFQAGQLGLPEGLGSTRTLLLQPGDVIAVVHRLGGQRVARVTLQHFAQ
ncbi:hypothetical protein D3C81_681650 [compost metagenome]